MTDAKTERAMAAGGGDSVERADGTEEEPDLATALAERDEYLDQLQRSRAEFANLRRRVEQERSQIREIANQALLAQLVPVLDDFQRALAAVPEDQRQTPLVQGLELIERKFWAVLERSGVSPIEAAGQAFDPSLHEAVDTVPGTAANTVVDVYQTGYRLGQRVLRPAAVKVGDPADGRKDNRDAAKDVERAELQGQRATSD